MKIPVFMYVTACSTCNRLLLVMMTVAIEGQMLMYETVHGDIGSNSV